MKRWYVIQLYAGYEEAVRTDILKRSQENGLEHLFGQILIPSAKTQKHVALRDEVEGQLFPGYMLIELDAVPEATRLVTQTPRVIRFLGGRDPVPLSSTEVERVFAQVRGDVVVSTKKSSFETGKEVEISDGPFAGFLGIIEKIDEDAKKLTVMVSIFGRMTPVELHFDQVKR